MRIYFVLEHVGGKGGVETVITAVTKGLSKEGHDVHVFLPNPSIDSSWETFLPNVHYYHNEKLNKQNRMEFLSERALGLSRKLNELPDADVIIATHAPQTSFYSRIATGNQRNMPIVSWLHNPPEFFNESHLINYADLHWTISKGITKKVKKILFRSSPVIYIGNPFNTEDLQEVSYLDQSDLNMISVYARESIKYYSTENVLERMKNSLDGLVESGDLL